MRVRLSEADRRFIVEIIDGLEQRMSLALYELRFSEMLDEVILPPLTAPDPKEKEIAAAERAMDQAIKRKHQAKLKDLLDKVQKTRAAAMGHHSPVPPQSPASPPKKPKAGF